MKKCLLVFLIFINYKSFSQIAVDTTFTAEELAASLAGAGVTIMNATITCADGGYGFFTNPGTPPSMSEGVLLTSGFAADAMGANDNPSTTGLMTDLTDTDLQSITTFTIRDACALEMDIVPTNDTLFFEYQFASEEYLTFIGSIGDVFGLFVSGPGITGVQNLAVIPGSSPPEIVSINTVNPTTAYSAFYVANGDADDGTDYSTTFTNCEYDGFTTLLPAKVAVTPCEVYHLKMVVADGSDQSLDSGVFIKSGSLTSYGISLSQSSTIGGLDYLTGVEGCNDGVITFTRTPVTPDSVFVTFQLGGTATEGADYAAVSDTVWILPDEASSDLIISVIADGIPEPTESVIVYLSTVCGAVTTVYDSIQVDIIDNVSAEASAGGPIAICEGGSAELSGSGGTVYLWTPSTYLSDPTIPNPICTPPTGVASLTYNLAVSLGPLAACSDNTTLTIDVTPAPVANAGIDDSLCIGSSLTLSGSGSATMLWEGTSILSGSTTANPVVNPSITTSYILTVSDPGGCVDKDTMNVVVLSLPTVDAGTSMIICPEEEVTLSPTGGLAAYTWTPSSTLSCSNCANPLASPSTTTTYTLTANNSFGCSNTDIVTLTLSNPVADAGPVLGACSGFPITLGGPQIIGNTYSWSPTTGLSNPSIFNPIATLTNNTDVDVSQVYTLTITDVNGCIETDTVTIYTYHAPIIDAGNWETINIGESYTMVTTIEDPASTFSWIPFDADDMNSNTVQNPVVSPDITTTYTFTVTDSRTCKNSDTVTISVYIPPFIHIPNAFGPECANEVNRTVFPWVNGIENIESYRIYNRWGELVYERNNIPVGGGLQQLTNLSWDGTHNNTEQGIQTFVWYIKALTVNGEDIFYSGNINLIK